LEEVLEMNVPSINPQLRKISESKTWDYVFIVRPDIDDNHVDIDCYIDEEWNKNKTMKGVNIEDARKTWNLLVKKGFERCTHL